MKYIYVPDSNNSNPNTTHNLTSVITYQTNDFLYSLIDGLKQDNFGLHTLTDVAMKIRECKDKYLSSVNGQVYADSGGYSIIIGNVSPYHIRRFIKCFNTYLTYEYEIYTYIFSLDIPFSKEYTEFNTKQNIYEYNKESLSDLKDILENNPILRNKVFFVWHFKMQSQYEIWKKLYGEIELNKLILNRSIGGMVGMREVTKKAFSPFTAIAFRCLLDFLNAGNFNNDFRLHFLGMYIQYDRFHIAFLERLFCKYLKDLTGVIMSYDSINFSHTARMNKYQQIYDIANNYELIIYPTAVYVDSNLIEKVYADNIIQEFIYAEIARRRKGQNLLNSSSFAPLSIYSNLCLDRLFEYIIDKYQLVDILIFASSPTSLEGRLRPIFEELNEQYGDIFKPKMIKSISENMEITFIYNDWFRKKRDYLSLDQHINNFISWIGFPDQLR